MEKLIIIALLLFSCTDNSSKTTTNPTAVVNSPSDEHLQVVDNIADAIMYIETFQGDVKNFRLGLGEIILYNGRPLKRGLAVDLISKAISKSKKWVFFNFENRGDLQVYNFKKIEE